MPIVAGVDFGTLSVRASIFDSERGRLGSASADYPLERRKEDPDHATQRHEDHVEAFTRAVRDAIANSAIDGRQIASLAIDTTGSSVIAVGENLQPLSDYYLWCDHRAKEEAARITEVAQSYGLEAIRWCGGAYSSEWGWAKVLHWLRHNPDKRDQAVTFLEHCDMMTAMLCGVSEPALLPRSVCAMGHKWMWNSTLGGFPHDSFLRRVDPLFAGVRAKVNGRFATSDKIAGHLSVEWANRLGLNPGIPIPTGALDAHWDAIGAGVKEGDVVNVVGTSTCVMAIARLPRLIPGVSGVVVGSIDPSCAGIEAGLSACGDIFDAIARRSNASLADLSAVIEGYRAGQSGLLRLTWDNGDRTILANPNLGGVTFGWTLVSTAADELFAAIEGTAFHTRIILERMAEYGTPINRVINGGGIPQKNETLNQVYANVFNKPVLVPDGDVTSIGSAIFAFLAAGVYPNLEAAQKAMCPKYRVYAPDKQSNTIYERLYAMYRKAYFGYGKTGSESIAAGEVLPELRRLAKQV